MPKTRNYISSNWEYRLSNTNGCKSVPSDPSLTNWTPAQHSPSVIHLELLTAGKIPDPNIGENERLMQWVGECDWEYHCEFPTCALDNPEGQSEVNEIVFEGLDTFATVYLNGTLLLRSENMFLPQRVDVMNRLVPAGGMNSMMILFTSPLKTGRELERRYGVKESLMRDPRRMYVRKAQVSRQSYIGFE